jgi:hypothetical protein
MTSMSHDAPRRSVRLLVPEMWPSLTIIAMWLSVLACALWGPDIVIHDVSGSNATIPSAVVLALFAFFGTWVVARSGFRRATDE